MKKVIAGLSLYPSCDGILITILYVIVGLIFLWAYRKAKNENK